MAYMLNRSFVVSQLKGGAALARHIAPTGVTLLDGELLREMDSGKTVYMVFDAVAVNGTTVRDHPLIQRLQAIGRHVIAPASKLSATSTPLHLVGKEFFPVTRVRKVFDRITARRRGDHTTYLYRGAHGSNLNDGVVFTPGDKGYFQPRGTLLKWKWFEDNTIDFFVDIDALESKKFVEGGKYKVDLKAWSETRNNRDGTKHYIHTRVSSEGVLTESQVQALDTLVGAKPGVVVEFGYDVRSSHWVQKCVRADKVKANHISVAWHTMEVMAENITKQDLIRIFTPKSQA